MNTGFPQGQRLFVRNLSQPGEREDYNHSLYFCPEFSIPAGTGEQESLLSQAEFLVTGELLQRHSVGYLTR